MALKVLILENSIKFETKQ